MFTPETLESRRLLSVSVSFNPKLGVLDVFGNGDGSEIHVSMVDTPTEASSALTAAKPEVIECLSPWAGAVRVYSSGDLVYSSVLSTVPVKHVNVYGTKGDDVISMYAWNSQVTSNLYGLAGDDTLVVTAAMAPVARPMGGDGNDTIDMVFNDLATFSGADAGAGKDTLRIRGAPIYDAPAGAVGVGELLAASDWRPDDDLRQYPIFAGDGDDLVELSLEFGTFGFAVDGGAGNDVIYGTANADELLGGAGDDLIYAGAGDDYLHGGLDDDVLFGEAGDDFLDHGGGSDYLNGGAGNDTAVVGKEDVWDEIEEMLT